MNVQCAASVCLKCYVCFQFTMQGVLHGGPLPHPCKPQYGCAPSLRYLLCDRTQLPVAKRTAASRTRPGCSSLCRRLPRLTNSAAAAVRRSQQPLSTPDTVLWCAPVPAAAGHAAAASELQGGCSAVPGCLQVAHASLLGCSYCAGPRHLGDLVELGLAVLLEYGRQAGVGCLCNLDCLFEYNTSQMTCTSCCT